MYESSDANSFGMVVRGSFESTVVPGFYGRGPADAFFRKHFNMGVQDVVNLYESFVVMMEKGIFQSVLRCRMADEYEFLIGSWDQEALPEQDGQ